MLQIVLGLAQCKFFWENLGIYLKNAREEPPILFSPDCSGIPRGAAAARGYSGKPEKTSL